MHGPNQQADDRLELIVIDPKIREILQRPFSQEMILPDRQNRKSDGFTPSYIPWDQITARLDEAFGSFWSFEIVKHSADGRTVEVVGQLRANGANVRETAAVAAPPGRSLGELLERAANDSLCKCFETLMRNGH